MHQLLTLDLDLSRLGIVERLHALDFGESDIVAVLEAVPCLVKSCYDALFVLQDEGCDKVRVEISFARQSQALTMETIIPASGVSPFVSTMGNCGPKSQNADLRVHKHTEAQPRAAFEKSPAHPNSPRTSAAMKWIPFAWV